jgi:putative ABC transport system ATP-binding protein
MAGMTLATEALTKRFRRGPEVVQAVVDVSVSFPDASLTLVVGPSGSGKTTLLNLLAGWEPPDSGVVLWQGEASDMARRSWSEVAVVPQRHGLLPELSIAENVVLADRIAGRVSTGRDLLAAVGLGEVTDALPEELSMGQQQRTAVVRAVAAGAAVLLVDEPTSSQDEEHARLVLGMLGDAAAAGATVIVASHDPIAGEYADRVVAMRDGAVDA